MRGSSAAHSPDCPSGGPGRSLGSCTSGDSSRRAWAQGPGEASSPAWGPPGVLRTSWPGLWVTVLCSPPKPFPQPESMTLGTPCLSEQGWPPSHREQLSFCSSARDSPVGKQARPTRDSPLLPRGQATLQGQGPVEPPEILAGTLDAGQRPPLGASWLHLISRAEFQVGSRGPGCGAGAEFHPTRRP